MKSSGSGFNRIAHARPAHAIGGEMLMHSLPCVIPNADDLLSLLVEDLGAILLKIAAAKMQPAGFTYEGVTEITIGSGWRPTATPAIRPTRSRKSTITCPAPGTGWNDTI